MKYSINEFIDNHNNSDQFFGFYDWFCSTGSLERKAKSFIPKLKFLVKQGILNGDTCYVWFKNNCPMNGTLYDDMRISVQDTDTFLGGFCPRTGHDVENKCTVWTVDPYNEYEYEFKTWNDFKKEVRSISQFKQILIDHFNPEISQD